MICHHHFSLHGQNTLITGAAGGIGQSMAHVFAEAGSNLVLTDINERNLELLGKNLKAKYPDSIIHTWVASLDCHETLEGIIPKAEELTGGIDILLNNAGITHDSMGHKMEDEDWDHVIAINLSATFRLCRAAVQRMRVRQYGRIISTASAVGTTGNIGQTNYCASKAGIIGMTKSFALENITQGITLNAISPGFINSPMTKKIPTPVIKKILAKIPAQAFGKPEDVAYAALFLASRESGYISGQTLHVNGGLVMV